MFPRRYFLIATLALCAILLALPATGWTPAHGASRRANADRASLVPAGFASHFALVDGVRYHYVIGGQGAPVILLHGWPETWYAWHLIMPSLAQHHTVIAPDLRGLGDTAKPAAGYDERTVAADIYALVHQLGYRQVSLVGHDLGADVSYAYASMHPTEVRRLVTLGATIIDTQYLRLPALARPYNYLNFTFNSTPAPLPEQLTAGRERTYLDGVSYQKLAHSPTALPAADIDEYVRHYAAPGGMHAGFAYYRAFFTDVDETAIFAKTTLPMPVLVVGDMLIKDSGERQMRTFAADVRGVIAQGSGHFVAEEQPQFLAQQLVTFLH